MRASCAALLLGLMAAAAQASDIPRAISAEDFPVPGATSVLLGRDLFFDPLLSGNRNIACATCHMPAQASTDGVPLTLGEGAQGLGSARNAVPGAAARIARHTPVLFNLGAHEFESLMADGRVQVDPTTRFGIRLPDGAFLERPVSSPLAAQALMPLVARDEMAGQPGSNPVADAVAAGQITGMNGAWHLIAQRIEENPEYRRRFDWLIGAQEPIHITHIAQALADFITFEFRATDSAFDAFLRGDDGALDNEQLRGLALFYGKAGCATCHSGPFQTDHSFHALGVPQIGPGKGHGASGTGDAGRGTITGNDQDMFRFRTPSLRNVALSAPYGHTGSIPSLEAMIRHHLDPLTSLAEYIHTDPDIEEGAMADFDETLAIAAAVQIEPILLAERDITALLRFLDALTDTSFATQRLGPPARVPSGLPVEGIETPPS